MEVTLGFRLLALAGRFGYHFLECRTSCLPFDMQVSELLLDEYHPLVQARHFDLQDGAQQLSSGAGGKSCWSTNHVPDL